MCNWWSPQNSSLPPREINPFPAHPRFYFCGQCLSFVVLLCFFTLTLYDLSLFLSFIGIQPLLVIEAKRPGMHHYSLLESTTMTYHDDTVTTILMRRGRGFTHPSHPPIVSRPTPFGLLHWAAFAFRRNYSDAIHIVEPLTKLWRKLIRKSLPIFLTHLIFKCKENLLKHLLQILLWRWPRCYGVAEEDEVRNDTSRIDSNHLTHTPEGRIFLFVIPYASQRSAPIDKYEISLNVVRLLYSSRKYFEQWNTWRLYDTDCNRKNLLHLI